MMNEKKNMSFVCHLKIMFDSQAEVTIADRITITRMQTFRTVDDLLVLPFINSEPGKFAFPARHNTPLPCCFIVRFSLFFLFVFSLFWFLVDLHLKKLLKET